MAASTDTPLTAEIWHLTIDDLFAPLPETIRLGGTGPFVINLSTSSAPIALPVKSMAGCEHVHMYLLQRTEDRRPRYRLRLGPFAAEDDADTILKKMREFYPGALTATADVDDLRAIDNLQPKAPALRPVPVLTIAPSQPAAKPAASVVPPQPVANKPAESVVRPQPVANKPAVSVVAPQPVANKPAVSVVAPQPVANKPAASVVLPHPVAPAASVAPPQPPAKPMPSIMPSVIAPPVLTVEQKIPARTPAPKPSVIPAVVAPPVLTVEQKIPVRAAALAPPWAAPPRQVRELGSPLPSLESTQTVRALTQLELDDEQASRWFVIQLSLSEQPFDPDTVPNLDIFTVYRLYCVAGIDQGHIVHALRLGFFSEEIAASAVASYLAAFYDKPAIKRVSSAERQRFAEQSLDARKDVGATGKHSVIEITDERFVRERRSGQPRVKL